VQVAVQADQAADQDRRGQAQRDFHVVHVFTPPAR
jgi:hypothetical protein